MRSRLLTARPARRPAALARQVRLDRPAEPLARQAPAGVREDSSAVQRALEPGPYRGRAEARRARSARPARLAALPEQPLRIPADLAIIRAACPGKRRDWAVGSSTARETSLV